MWECPLLAHLPLVNTATTSSSTTVNTTSSTVNASNSSGDAAALWEGRRHLLCVSPDYCVNVSTYWLGRYEARTATFDLGAAAGPYVLDLGDILYAPNLMTDKQVGCWERC
jgi:beta-fructofuranosidase